MTLKTDRPLRHVSDLDAKSAALFDAAKNGVLLMLLGRHGGELRIPVAELDEYPKGRGASLRVEDSDAGPVLVYRLLEDPTASPPRPGGFVKPA